MSCHAAARAKTQVILKMLEPELRLASKDPNQSAPVPSTSAARIEGQTTVDQAERDLDVLARGCEQRTREGEDVRVVRGAAQRPSRQIDTGAPGRRGILGPAVDFEPCVTMAAKARLQQAVKGT